MAKKQELRVKDLLKVLAGVNPDAKIVFLSEYDDEHTPVVVIGVDKDNVTLDWHPDYTR